MKLQSGPILFAAAAALVLAALVGWLVAALYRRRMVALMRGSPAGTAAPPASPASPEEPPRQPPPPPTLAANDRARWRLATALTLLSAAMALAQSWLTLRFEAGLASPPPAKVLVLALVDSWPVVLGWGLVFRWRWRRYALVLAGYFLAVLLAVMARSSEEQSWGAVAMWMAAGQGEAVVAILLVAGSTRFRAVAPTLLPGALLLCLASVAGLQAFQDSVMAGPGLLPLIDVLGLLGAQLLFLFLPWAIFAWPAYVIGRWIGAAYRRKRFSDTLYMFSVYWLIVLVLAALPAFQGVGGKGFLVVLPIALVPLAMPLLRRWLRPGARPPTLLVLRVFQRDAAVEALFEDVVERWRYTGNTILIAGTDLVSKTLDPDDLLSFVSGKLAARFIATAQEVPARLAALDLEPDPDGRYRVNECYCTDASWQAALRALVARTDVVLMDLRGLRPENRGCRFELGVLARASDLWRVVLLHDATTDRVTAEAELGPAPGDRFVWMAADSGGGSDTVFRALFGATPP